ncbi:hypothetical protein Q7P37_002727 [Cladosporium fusiforme]
MASAPSTLSLDSAPNTWITFSLALASSGPRGWLYSGCAIESLLLLFGPPQHWSISRYGLLSYLHVFYAFASTSWLFHAIFTFFCWPLILATCLAQHAALSSFTRGRLRSLMKFAHFYRDKVAFFGLPSLVFDSGVDGLMTIRGITVSILDLNIQLHGIEIDLDLGSGHELSIHSEGITIKLFRDITIDEVYGVHWFEGHQKDPHIQEGRRDSHVDGKSASRSKTDSLKPRAFTNNNEETKGDVPDHQVKPNAGNVHPDIDADIHSPPDDNIRRNRIKEVLSRDAEAEERYNRALYELRRTNHLHHCRSQAKNNRTSIDADPTNGSEHCPLVCSNLRKFKPQKTTAASQITLSRLMELLLPVSRLLDRAPIILRFILWLLSQSHNITCPVVCFSADGRYLGDELLQSLFRKHAADDSRIQELKQEVSSWLSEADLYLDFMSLTGQSTVPILTSNKITAELRSTGVVISRLGTNIVNVGRVAKLSGADASFKIPTRLLPSHASVAPPPRPDEDDTASVSMSIRASLPAYFSESSLNFAATLSKTSQMLDIEEEAGRASKNKSITSGTDNKDTSDSTQDNGDDEQESRTHRVLDKIPHVHIGAAAKHPIDRLKQSLHKEVKKTAVDKVDGAWFAKWTNKCLEELEWLDGDFGYSTEVPVAIARDRRTSRGSGSP